MSKTHLILFCILCLLSSCDDSSGKRLLLQIDKPWSERSQTEKLIGCWCNEPGYSHTSRRGVKISFSDKLCFYNDGTMEEFMVSHSYANSTSLMYTGSNVTVENNRLTFDSDKYGSKEYMITLDQYSLKMSTIGLGKSDNWSRCY